MDDEDVGAVDDILDGSFEKLNDSDDDILIHRNDVVPPPIKPEQIPYQVKMNDILSGNIPFATNVSVEHIFIIPSFNIILFHLLRQRVIAPT